METLAQEKTEDEQGGGGVKKCVCTALVYACDFTALECVCIALLFESIFLCREYREKINTVRLNDVIILHLHHLHRKHM